MTSFPASAAKALASFTAGVTNLVQARELASDILEDTNYFTGPRWAKVLAGLILVLLAAQEFEKVRQRFKEAT